MTGHDKDAAHKPVGNKAKSPRTREGVPHPAQKGKALPTHQYQQVLRTRWAHLSPQHYTWTKGGRAQFCQRIIACSSVWRHYLTLTHKPASIRDAYTQGQ